MTLVVETGTGLSTAESFATVAQADTRLSGFGDTLWPTMSEAEKEQALRRATAFMEQQYRQAWRGTRLLRAQALSWPRYGVCVDGFTVESSVVPAEVIAACIDLAYKAAFGELSPDLERAVIREKVGPLETEYSAHSPQSKRFVAIAGALAPYLKGSPSMVALVRC